MGHAASPLGNFQKQYNHDKMTMYWGNKVLKEVGGYSLRHTIQIAWLFV